MNNVLLDKYFSGHCSEEERQIVEKYLLSEYIQVLDQFTQSK